MKIRTTTEPYYKEIKARRITYKNIEFGIPLKNEHGLEFTHIKSGLGFNGNGKKNMKSLKSAEKRIGSKKFINTIKQTTTIEEYIDELKARNKIWKELKQMNLFPVMPFMPCKILSELMGRKPGIDLFAIEKYLGIADKNISIEDKIREKYGSKVAEMVRKLI